jgi:hypothetical protein
MKTKQKGFKISIDDGYTEYTYPFEEITQDYSTHDIYTIIRKAFNHKEVKGILKLEKSDQNLDI